jgi:hypothetical protein
MKKLVADFGCHTDHYYEHAHSGPWLPLERINKVVAHGCDQAGHTNSSVLTSSTLIWAGNDVQLGEDCTALDAPSVRLRRGQKARVLEVDPKGQVAVEYAGGEHWCRLEQLVALDRVDDLQESLRIEECVGEVRARFLEFERAGEVMARPRAAWFQHLAHWAVARQREEALKDGGRDS